MHYALVSGLQISYDNVYSLIQPFYGHCIGQPELTSISPLRTRFCWSEVLLPHSDVQELLGLELVRNGRGEIVLICGTDWIKLLR